MDEEIEGGLAAVEPEAEDEGGDLSVYNLGSVRAAMKERSKLAAERQRYYDDLTAKLTAQRAGPSFSERMYQLSSAFFAPTTTRGFSGVMGNVMPVLQAQQQAQRAGEMSRQEALDKLRAAQLTQREGLANQDVSTALAMAKINNKPPVRGIAVGDTLRNPYTGAIIEPPPPPIGTIKVYEGRQYTFIGGDQYDKNNWKVVK